MKIWTTDPSPELVAAFNTIARTRMHDVPICNWQLHIEAVGFQQRLDGHWAGVMITPWAINLLCLPGQPKNWPPQPACSKHHWRFPSGDYEFTVAEEDSIGIYHLCSLFSPPLEFANHEAAIIAALAAVDALFAEPQIEPPEAKVTSRRAFLGLG